MFESGHFLICFAYDSCFLVQIGAADLLGLCLRQSIDTAGHRRPDVGSPHRKVAADDFFESENLVPITPAKRARNTGVERRRRFKWLAVPAID